MHFFLSNSNLIPSITTLGQKYHTVNLNDASMTAINSIYNTFVPMAAVFKDKPLVTLLANSF
jgi:hypothetical protein